MSHFQEIKTCIKNKSALIKALQKMGFEEDQIENHEEAQNLYGFRGDKRQQKANVIIRRKNVGSMSNDLGFTKKEDGTYEAIISDYDSRRYNEAWLQKTSTHYEVEQAKEAFEAKGWNYTETKDEEGRMQLVGVSY